MSNTGYVLRGGYYVFKTNYLKPFPIHTINFSNSAEKTQHDQMIALVERMLAPHRQHPSTPGEKTMLEREITATDRQIDALVYESYGLTEEEIKVVEEDHE